MEKSRKKIIKKRNWKMQEEDHKEKEHGKEQEEDHKEKELENVGRRS